MGPAAGGGYDAGHTGGWAYPLGDAVSAGVAGGQPAVSVSGDDQGGAAASGQDGASELGQDGAPGTNTPGAAIRGPADGAAAGLDETAGGTEDGANEDGGVEDGANEDGGVEDGANEDGGAGGRAGAGASVGVRGTTARAVATPLARRASTDGSSGGGRRAAGSEPSRSGINRSRSGRSVDASTPPGASSAVGSVRTVPASTPSGSGGHRRGAESWGHAGGLDRPPRAGALQTVPESAGGHATSPGEPSPAAAEDSGPDGESGPKGESGPDGESGPEGESGPDVLPAEETGSASSVGHTVTDDDAGDAFVTNGHGAVGWSPTAGSGSSGTAAGDSGGASAPAGPLGPDCPLGPDEVGAGVAHGSPAGVARERSARHADRDSSCPVPVIALAPPHRRPRLAGGASVVEGAAARKAVRPGRYRIG